MSWYNEYNKLSDSEKEIFHSLTQEQKEQQKLLWIEPKIKEIAESLNDLVNTGDQLDIQLLIKYLTKRTHRYLQTMLFQQVVLGLIVAWADDYKTGNHDPRNHWTVTACNTLLQYAKKQDIII